MKKYFNYLLMAAVVLGLSWSVTSCKDDDDKDEKEVQKVVVDEDLIAHGLEVSGKGASVSVEVKINGTWSADLEGADEDWVTIVNNHLFYSNSRTLKLDVSANPSGADRKATLNLFGLEGDPITINITQHGRDTNDDIRSSALFFQDDGLGHGVVTAYAMDTAAVKKIIDVEKAKDPSKKVKFDWTNIKGNNIVYNMEQIQKLVNNGVLDKGAYSETRIPTYDLKATLIDSTVSQKKDFGVGINMELSFGFIEFSAGVTYTAKKTENRAHVDYSICRNAPMYNSVVSPLEIATYAKDQSIDAIEKYGEEWEKLEEQVVEKYGSWEELQKKNKMIYNAWKKKLDKYRPDFGKVFSTGFTALLWEYYKAMINDDENAAKKALANIDEAFSPFFITGGNWGGSLNVLCRIDTLAMTGKDSLYATLTGSLAGIGSVNGELHLSTEGLNLYRQANIDVNMVGGDPAVGDMVTAWLLSPDVTSYAKLQQTLAAWIDSMKSPADPEANDKNCSVPTEFFYSPIWQLFDPDYRDFARDWFVEKYKNNKSISAYIAIAEGTHTDSDHAGATMAGNGDKTK